jgi:hypothetical protein
VTGYRLCESGFHQGRRWLPCTHFPPLRWTEDGTIRWVKRSCQTCFSLELEKDSRQKKEKYAEKIRSELAALSVELGRPATRRDLLFHRHHKLPADPFRMYLQRRVQEIGHTNVTASIGWDHARTDAFLTGRYMKNGKTYMVKYVQLATVDHACVRLGDHWSMVYPDEYQEDN